MDDTLVSIFVPILVLALGGVGWLYKNEREKRRELQARLDSKKAEIYENYILSMTSLFSKDKNEIKSGKISEQRIFDIVKKINEFHRFVLIYGSIDIINTQSKYTSYLYSDGKYESKYSGDQTAGAKNHLYYLTEMINGMRRELGHKNEKITLDDLARLFITDYVPGSFL